MILDIDIASVSDINKAINLLKVKRAELQRKNNPDSLSKNQKHKLIFDSCNVILNTDISHLYNNLDLDSAKKYYVYAHLDPSLNIAVHKHGISTFAATLGMSYRPCYIGKGTGDRCYDLNRNETHRKIRQRLKSFDKDIIVYKIKENISELEALCLESKLIDIFGLVGKAGTLVNLDEGVNSSNRRLLYLNSLKNLSGYNRDSNK